MLCTVINDRTRKGDNGFRLVFNSNFISIMHRFWDNDVFLLTGNDVMAISPLGGTVHEFWWWILKGWPQVHIHAPSAYFAYLQTLTSFSMFSFWLGFSYYRWNLWGFGGIWPNDLVKLPKNTCFEGTSLRQTASFELSCVEIGSRVWAVRVARKEKPKTKI